MVAFHTYVLYLCFLTNVQSLSEPRQLRIIGGGDVFSGEYPFAAAIYVQTGDGRFFCGGSLMSDEWVLTSGHCVLNAVLFTIHLGSSSLSKEDTNRVVAASSEYILHPDFNPDTIENDLGLIKLRMPVTYTVYILPVFLPVVDISPSEIVTVIGWGQTSDADPELSDILQQASVSVISNADCQLVYGDQITENMTCVAGNHNEGTCTGDNGGALVVFSNRAYRVAGVSSFISGSGCENTDPSGFTKVFPYTDWISKIIYE